MNKDELLLKEFYETEFTYGNMCPFEELPEEIKKDLSNLISFNFWKLSKKFDNLFLEIKTFLIKIIPR